MMAIESLANGESRYKASQIRRFLILSIYVDMKESIDFLHISGPEANAWENFESLCANLIECRYTGHPVVRIRPNPGDDGMDILVGSIEKPTHIFQCKYFIRGIGPSQRQQIRDSYERAGCNWTSPPSWTLVTPIDPAADELRWFEKNFPTVNAGTARRWWGKTHLFNLLSRYEHVAETYFDLQTRQRIREIHDKVINAPETLDDETALRTVYLFFDRPAFRLAFENEASIPDFDKAMKDTILALNTGLLKTRDGVVVAQGKPRSAFTHDMIGRHLANATRHIEELTVRLARAVEIGVFKRYKGIDTIWVFDHPDARKIAEKMNSLRNEVLREVNKALTYGGVANLPYITEKLDARGYMGKSNHHFTADADHLD